MKKNNIAEIMIYDPRIPAVYIESLKRSLANVRFLPLVLSRPKGYRSISYHPDIYLFILAPDIAVYAPCVASDLLIELEKSGMELLRGSSDPGEKYPRTAAYNAVRIGQKVFLSEKCADEIVLNAVKKAGLSIVDISQGYARCSILPLGNDSFITTDKKIAEKGRKEGMQIFLIKPDNIFLPGHEHGFIGGCGGLSMDGRVVILGDPFLYPEFSEIKSFLNKNSSGIVKVDGLPLFDGGGLLFAGSFSRKDPL